MTQDPKPASRKARVKKSETLEVRIPHETKQAFLTACREDGTTASEVVREQVQSYLDQRERPSQQEEKRTLVMQFPKSVRHYAPRVAAGGIAAIGLAALAALPSAAAPDFKAQFSRLDANGDGVLSVDEFLGPKDHDAGGGNEEKKIVIETRSTIKHEDSDAKVELKDGPKIELQQQAFAFYLPDELAGSADKEGKEDHREYKFIARKEVSETKDGQGAASHAITLTVDDIRKDEFNAIDANKDGKVSLDEYQAHQTELLTNGFRMLDVNKDTFLNLEEYTKIAGPPEIKLDWHHTGDEPDVSKIEIPGVKQPSPEAIKAAFTRQDVNKDGKLSLQEYLPKKQ